MKTVFRYQQLKTPPSSVCGAKASGVMDFATELTNDPLDDVGGGGPRE